MSLGQLLANTRKIPTTKRHHIADQVQLVGGFQAVKLDGSRIVFQSKTNTGHAPKVSFDYEETTNGTQVVTQDGTDLSIRPKSSTTDDILVSCNCEDFFYRFATVNSENGVLFGNIERVYVPKGTRKLSQQEYPISSQPAICKHVIKLTDLLRAQQVIR